MAEWGKYLRNAVANVEQQIDRVLLEDDQNSQSAPQGAVQPVQRQSKRPDLSERLRLAAAGKAPAETPADAPKSEVTNTSDTTKDMPNADSSKPENQDTQQQATEESPPDVPLVTVKDFAPAPDLKPVLQQARQIALAVKRDDVLALVDSLEQVEKTSDLFTKTVEEKLQSVHSKVALMGAQMARGTTGADQKIALLMEEGQRLSQQELKLGMLVRKLRTENREVQARASKSSVASAELETLRKDNTQLRTQNRESEALISNYQAQLKEIPADADSGQGEASQQFIAERQQWHRLETQLLQRISELETASSQRHTSTTQLQESLASAQKSSREAQDQAVVLQDEVDSLKDELNALRKAPPIVVSQPTELTPIEARVSEEQELKLDTHDSDTNEASESVTGAPSEIDPLDTDPLDADPSALPFDQVGDEQTVGPSGPFGALENGLNDLNVDEGLYGIENESRSAEGRGSIDSLSFLGHRSRQDSLANSLNEGSNSHLIKKLTVTISRLQNELAIAKQDAQFARQQRQDAQSEIVKYLSLRDELSNLESSHVALSAAHNSATAEIERLKADLVDKTEQVDELEADVRDLKEMYREQVEALVGEIEKLKR